MVAINFATLLSNGVQTIVDADGQTVTVTATFTSGFHINSIGQVQSDNAVDTDADTFTLTFSKPVKDLTFSIGDVNSNNYQGGFNDHLEIQSTLAGTPVVTNLSTGTSGTTAIYEAPFNTNIVENVSVNTAFDQITVTNFDADRQHGWIFLSTGDVGDVVCFTAGTMIETETGCVAVENLSPGDLVVTRDRGAQPIRWVGKKEISSAQLERNDKLRPVCIKAGALANTTPARDLIVSRQHRMLTVSRLSKRMFDENEVLISAIKLTALPDIEIMPVDGPVIYYHLLFDQHEIVYAEGAPSESLHTGPEALKTLPQTAREGIFTLFPELSENTFSRASARPIPPGKRQQNFIRRLEKNKHSFISESPSA